MSGVTPINADRSDRTVDFDPLDPPGNGDLPNPLQAGYRPDQRGSLACTAVLGRHL